MLAAGLPEDVSIAVPGHKKNLAPEGRWSDSVVVAVELPPDTERDYPARIRFLSILF